MLDSGEGKNTYLSHSTLLKVSIVIFMKVSLRRTHPIVYLVSYGDINNKVINIETQNNQK